MHMLRSVSFYITLLFIGSTLVPTSIYASEGEAGEVTFTLGKAFLNDSKILSVGMKVSAGDVVSTLNNGHVHIRFIDEGLVSVRPNSQLVIEHYEFDAKHPEKSVIKFNLNEGIMRSISGKGAKAARDKFRLNTPIAAIGVRGTDFVVKTNNDSLQAIVNEGAIAVAPFSSECQAAAFGPCQTNAVELTGEARQLLEFSTLYAAPRLIPLAKKYAAELSVDQSRLNDDGSIQTNTSEDESIEDSGEKKGLDDQADPSEQSSEDNTDTNSSNVSDATQADVTEETSNTSLSAEGIQGESVSEKSSDADAIKDTSTDIAPIETPTAESSKEMAEDTQDETSTEVAIEEATNDELSLSDGSYIENDDALLSDSENTVSSSSDENQAVPDSASNDSLLGENSAIDTLTGTELKIGEELVSNSKLVWGRFEQQESDKVIFDLETAANPDRRVLIQSDDLTLFRSVSELESLDTSLGNVAFNLSAFQAQLNNNGNLTQMSMDNAELTIDFLNQAFSTELQMSSELTSSVSVSGSGSISDQGLFNFYDGSTVIRGATTLEGDTASYLFLKDIDLGTIEGVTYWDR